MATISHHSRPSFAPSGITYVPTQPSQDPAQLPRERKSKIGLQITTMSPTMKSDHGVYCQGTWYLRCRLDSGQPQLGETWGSSHGHSVRVALFWIYGRCIVTHIRSTLHVFIIVAVVDTYATYRVCELVMSIMPSFYSMRFTVAAYIAGCACYPMK